MVATALESRAHIATTAGPLANSFLPKFTHLLQAQVFHRPPFRLSFHGVSASTKQKKKAGNTSSTARDWSYEHLMVLWDEVFGQCCTDSVKATKIRDLSHRGLPKHGRGCVLVYHEVQTRPRGSGTGFTSKPPKSSRRVPDFVTLDWYAVYFPREFLLDPRKAPNEMETVPKDGETSSADSTPVAVTSTEGNVDTARMVDRSHEDVTVDVEAIIRSAQDVYKFGSEDDDDDDDDNDDDELNVSSDEANLNNDPLLILDDKEETSAASTAEFSLNLNEQDNDTATAASVSNGMNEEPLVIFDEDLHAVTVASEAEMQSRKEIGVDNADCDDGKVQLETIFGPEDGAAEIAYSTLIETGEDQGEIVVVDDTQHSKGRPRLRSIKVGEANAFEMASSLNDGPSGRDGGAPNATGSNEACSHTLELHEENTEMYASSLNGSAASKNTSMGGQGMQDQDDVQSEDDVELVTQQMLFATMRGVDRTRLMSLTANFDFEAKTFRYGRKTAVIDTNTMDAGGEDPYNPNEDELVLLLHLVTDGRPAYGADVVIACKDEASNLSHEKDIWKLKGKYKI